MKSSVATPSRLFWLILLSLALGLVVRGPSSIVLGQEAPPDSDPFGASAATAKKEDDKATKEIARDERRSNRFDLKDRSKNEVEIEAALDQPTKVEFLDEPLSGVIEFWEEFHKIPIEFDQRALDDLGIDSNAQITRSLSGITLRAAMQLMLKDLDLTYIVQDEVLVITTREREDRFTDTRLYDLRRLPDYSAEDLARVVTVTVSPASWTEQGGLGVAQAFSDTLIVHQSQRVHREINDLLLQLERRGAKQE